MATHSSTLAWRIPWREEPGRLQSMGSLRVGHDGSDLACMQVSTGICVHCHFSHVWLLVTTWTIVRQVPLSIEFSKQECWTGQPFPPPGDFPYPGIKPGSLALKADSLPSEPPGKPHICIYLWGFCGGFGVCVCISSLFQKLLEIRHKIKVTTVWGNGYVN